MSLTLLFGTSGPPRSTRYPTTESGIERIAELGLDCMEVQFVRRVHMSEDTALRVRDLARAAGIVLSAHAPYFVNLNAADKEKLQASRERLIQTARIASLLGATTVVFHAGYYLQQPPSAAYPGVKTVLAEIVDALRAEDNGILLRPETTGKRSQFGTLEEVLRLSADIEGVAPCIDFAHLHAREGAVNSYEEFIAVLQQVETALGRPALDHLHLHVAGVHYGQHGEIRHLDLTGSDLAYGELLAALKDTGAGGRVICESPSLEEDALLLRARYRRL